MSLTNKAILKEANEAISAGDHEKFLSFCGDDSVWTFVGDQTLHGKEAIRQYIKSAYLEPPRFNIDQVISEGDLVTAIGKISLKQQDGSWVDYQYCDLWRFREDRMSELTAFVI
ncbi:nuclear transport factor 2 family protein [Pedobacter mucosus]|uniref:nuclear transport factor 2 family protein n=1 Tax=Pedobacter mucosus TaxID=2895286 RepID=UPI001EE46E80|nr:nuclear transport factor 2 family protein [Pedobacter mucosus]UKT65019.1 nuclear transport factor 2 family protein [Pedobacter mucosus]